MLEARLLRPLTGPFTSLPWSMASLADIRVLFCKGVAARDTRLVVLMLSLLLLCGW